MLMARNLSFMLNNNMMQAQISDQSKTPNFSKGITLEDYLKGDTQTLQEHNLSQRDRKQLSSLMGELVVHPNDMSTFQIQEADEDNEYESRQTNVRKTVKLNTNIDNDNKMIEKGSIILEPLQLRRESMPLQKSNARSSLNSNSPSPQRNKSIQKTNDMFRSLYGSQFKQQKNVGIAGGELLHSTLYSKSIFPNQLKNQKYFNSKHRLHYKEVSNYENLKLQKYAIRAYNESPTATFLNMRVEGIKDKYLERKKTTQHKR